MGKEPSIYENVLILPTTDRVLFPGVNVTLETNDDDLIRNAREILKENGYAYAMTMDRNQNICFEYGILCKIKQIVTVKREGQQNKILIECLSRAQIESVFSIHDEDGAPLPVSFLDKFQSVHQEKENTEPFDRKEDRDAVPFDRKTYFATICEVPMRGKKDTVRIRAIVEAIQKEFVQFKMEHLDISDSICSAILDSEDPEIIAREIAFRFPLHITEKYEIFSADRYETQIKAAYKYLLLMVSVMREEQEIQNETKSYIEGKRREAMEQARNAVLMHRLGGQEDEESNERNFMEEVKALHLSEDTEKKLLRDCKQYQNLPEASQESNLLYNYLDTVLSLPWNKTSEVNKDICYAESVLEADHYGLKKVKERILESLSVMALEPKEQGQIICLYGPPGVGKTSIAKSIAKATGREYVRVSLGGIRDEADIRGHRKTYLGAMPGRIMEALQRAKTRNPLILLDEIDKLSKDRGDPASALLEVLDSEQNHTFRDHYIEVPFDLGDVLFLATANTLDTIPAPLLDRMDIVELSSYTREEKFKIALLYLVPKQISKNGLKKTQVRFADGVLYDLIDFYTREAGVRQLERMIGTLCKKAAKKIVEGSCKSVGFTSKNLESYLGTKKYRDEWTYRDQVGVVNGLAWTSAGGVLMPMEVLQVNGTGKVELTGSLGDVMQESAKIAITYTRSVADKYHIDAEFFKKQDMHIHAPEGAVPKDGPSAGVTMTTAIVSALSGRKVRGDVAMTGEITLHGRVLPIGGLREKSMAAYRAGMKKVIIPMGNVPDLDEVDDVVKDHITFIPADDLETVLDHALI